MKRFKSLLVHLDLQGTHDVGALRYASAVSRLSHSKRIEFVHTRPGETLFAGFLNGAPAVTAAWLKQAKGDVRQLAQRHFRGAPGCSQQVQVLGGAGFPELLRRLRHRSIDLIIIGKCATNAAFVEKLVRKAPCSVLVVPAGQSAAYRRIVVPTDFSEHSAQALEVAVAFAKARRLRSLHCFHGYQIPYGHHKATRTREEFQQEGEAWARQRYQEFLETVALGGLEPRFICRESPIVALGILQQAERQKSSLLVMGARGKDALAAALLGSVSAQVVRETQIPILIVKTKGSGRALLDFLLGGDQS